MGEERLTLSIEETSRLLGLSRNMAYALSQRGVLPTVRVGRRRLVPRLALLKWLEQSDESCVGSPKKGKAPEDSMRGSRRRSRCSSVLRWPVR